MTVILGLVWLLESSDISATQIGSGLNALLGLPNLKPEHVHGLREALRSYKAGMCFANALHLALSEGQ